MFTVSPLINFTPYINSIYQIIVKQMIVVMIVALVVGVYLFKFRNIRMGGFGKGIYIILILCTIYSTKYCIDIYGNPFSEFKLDDINYYKSGGKTSYYELDLSNKTNISKCMLYTPTSYNDGKCIIYINDKDADENLEDILFYRDIVIDHGDSFMILSIDISKEHEAIKKIESIVKILKEDDTIKEAILMGTDDSGELSIDAATLNKSDIDGVIALYPCIDKMKKISAPVLLIQDDHLVKEDKSISVVELPGCNHFYNDVFISTSIIGDKIKKEMTHWMSTEL